MTTVLERREINNQVFLIQFYFKSHEVNDLSLDKYIGVDIWSQIYKKLEPILEAYHTANDTQKEKKISLYNTQLELVVSWNKLTTCHEEYIQDVDGKSCDNLHPKVLTVKVGMDSTRVKDARDFPLRLDF